MPASIQESQLISARTMGGAAIPEEECEDAYMSSRGSNYDESATVEFNHEEDNEDIEDEQYDRVNMRD